MRKIHFVSGLPRSGSTLLVNVLDQNPRFQVSGTSGLVDVLLDVRNSWDRRYEMMAMPLEDSERAKGRVLRAVMDSFHPDVVTLQQVSLKIGPVFDKSRTWLPHLEMAECLLGRKAKVLVPIRDVRDVLASLEMIWRSHAASRQIPTEASHYKAFQSMAGRLGVWGGADGLVGMAYMRVLDAVARGFKDRLYVVPYERFTRHPRTVLSEIYDFLGEPFFEHDFEHVDAAVAEDDLAYGMPGLHATRPKVEPSKSYWQEALGEAGRPYGAWNQALGYPAD